MTLFCFAFVSRIFMTTVSKTCLLHYCFWQSLIHEGFMISTYVSLLSGCTVIKHFLTYLKKLYQGKECCNQYVDQITLIVKNSKGSIRVKVKVKIKVKVMVPEYASKVWNMVPLELKDLNDIEMFKSEIRKWEPRQCEYTLCLP